MSYGDSWWIRPICESQSSLANYNSLPVAVILDGSGLFVGHCDPLWDKTLCETCDPWSIE